MSETHTQPEDENDPRLHPTDILINVIVTFLTPMFLGPGNMNVALAQMAAMETVNSFRIRNQAELIVVAQVIAFAMTSLGSLSLSMMEEVTLPTVLRLRNNAVALNRAEQRQRRVLAEPVPEQRVEQLQPEPQPQPATATAPAPAKIDETAVLAQFDNVRNPPGQARTVLHNAAPAAPRPVAPDAAGNLAWANAVAQVAKDSPVPLPDPPPSQPAPMGMRAAALGSVATSLLTRSG